MAAFYRVDSDSRRLLCELWRHHHHLTACLAALVGRLQHRPWSLSEYHKQMQRQTEEGEVGVLYYVYMACLSIFCTNAINILAGINGVEVGQTIVIVVAILCNNILWMQSETVDLASAEVHTFSFYLMLPLLGVMLALFAHNRSF